MNKAQEDRNKRKELTDKLIFEMNRLIESKKEDFDLTDMIAATKAVNDYIKQKDDEEKYRYSGYEPTEFLFKKGEW